MPRAQHSILSILVFLLAFYGTARAGFDLSTVASSDRVADSKYILVSNGEIKTFDDTNLSALLSSTTGTTMLVERVKSATGVSSTDRIPDHFALQQNFPNPFNMSTKIVYSVPAQAVVSLKVYDMLGREVAVLVNGSVTAGRHTVDFHNASIASGTYFYRLASTAASGAVNVEMKKMILLK